MAGTAHSGGRGNRKTRQEHELLGTFRSDRHAEHVSPTPTAGSPEMPDGLNEAEQAEWHRLIWAFEDMGMLHRVDVLAIQQYCHLYVETESVAKQQAETAASLQILEDNLAGIDKSDLVQVFGQIVILRKLISKCTDQLRSGRMALRQWLVEFGLTPSSRGRVKLPAVADQVDEFAEFQRKRGVA